jgi:hypothetical protein
MTRRFVAFDLETAKLLGDAPGDLLDHRPLGITCAVAIRSDRPEEPVVWHGRDTTGRPTPKMSRTEAAEIVAQLERWSTEGYAPVTWNGLGFDFPVLGDESGLLERCAQLAERHVDMQFHFFCAAGFRLGLQGAAEGMGLEGKTKGVSGAMAPVMWAEGKHAEVIEYCTQDVRTTLAVVMSAEEKKALTWKTKRGDRKSLALPDGWLSVAAANMLPLPDVSWMKDPPTRAEYFRWFPKRGSEGAPSQQTFGGSDGSWR